MYRAYPFIFCTDFLDDFFNNSLYQKGCELVAVTVL